MLPPGPPAVVTRLRPSRAPLFFVRISSHHNHQRLHDAGYMRGRSAAAGQRDATTWHLPCDPVTQRRKLPSRVGHNLKEAPQVRLRTEAMAVPGTPWEGALISARRHRPGGPRSSPCSADTERGSPTSCFPRCQSFTSKPTWDAGRRGHSAGGQR